MDDIDQQLIGLLRDNARASLVSLAKALRVSRATVQNRISRLEANGTIVVRARIRWACASGLRRTV